MVLCRKADIKTRMFVLIVLAMALFSACSDDGGPPLNVDVTIPVSVSWTINSVMNQDPLERTDLVIEEGYEDYIDPQIHSTVHNGRLHMAYYDVNPDVLTRDDYPYRLMYKSFAISDVMHLNPSNTILEVVHFIDNEFRNLAGLSISVSAGKAVIAYPAFKLYIQADEFDLNNQGDVMIAVRDGASTWRHEIGAFGYVPPSRNPVFRDGLAMSDFCVLGTDDGQVMLSFQFYNEGIDSYNFSYPDLRFIEHPVDTFVNGDVTAVADLEQTVEGNIYVSGASGIQLAQGKANRLIRDSDGNPLVFYFRDNRANGSSNDFGLRYARQVEGEWEEPEWIERRVQVACIAAAVKSDGGIFVAYTVKDVPDYIVPEASLPSIVKYAEQIDVITGYDDDGEEIHEWEWHYGFVNYNTICGDYLTMALDASDQPVVGYYDEMNFTLNRFFSRMKVSRRTVDGYWEVYVITPEDVGLSNNTSPYEAVPPGSSDKFYIGKYNHLWLDVYDRVNLLSYSTVNKKIYFFQMN